MHRERMKGFGSIEDKTGAVVREVISIAGELGVSAAQVGLAWLRIRPVPVIPISSARKLSQPHDNLASLDVVFGKDQLERLEHASAVTMGFPHDFLALDSARALNDRIKAGSPLPQKP